MLYDYLGQPLVRKGKRRPNTPGRTVCSCGNKTLKVIYGTYEYSCGKVFRFQFGILVEGKHFFNR